jgi:hypothetical protein
MWSLDQGGHGWTKSGELLTGEGRGSGWGGSRSRKESICVRTRGGERAGGWARRMPAATASRGLAPASRRPGLDSKRVWELQSVLGKVLVARFWQKHGRSTGYIVAPEVAAMAA